MPTQTININVSTVGASILNTASPSAVTWIRVNADNTITYRSAAQTLSDLGAGVGTVTSVSGTLNRVTSTGGATPVIDISATFEALLGKVANPLSQFAATTSAQLAGVISDETGSGALVFGTSPTLVTPTVTTSIQAGSSAGILIKSSGGLDCMLHGAGGANNTAYTGLKLDYGTASTIVYLDASKNLISLANGAANTYLKNDGSGGLSWETVASGASLSGLTVATSTNTINNSNYAQVWSWNSLTTEIALTNSSSSITTGSINKIISTSTVGNGSKGLEIAISGANSTGSKTNYGQYTAIANTGSSSTNVACYLSASGGTVNYSLQAPNGNVIIGNTSPGTTPYGTSWLDVNGGINACYVAGSARFKVAMGSVNQVTLSDGNSGWDLISTGANPIRFFYNTSTESFRFSGAGKFSNTAGDGTAYIHLKAGTATANTAPIKLTAGTNLTTPENGAIEFDGTNIFITVGGVRKTFTIV